MPTPREGFDPEKHQMLQDGKSWILKDTPISFRPIEKIRLKLNALVDQAVKANPGWSPQQALDQIRALEEKYDHHFESSYTTAEPHRKLVREKRRLSVMNELNLISEEEKKELAKLNADFKNQ